MRIDIIEHKKETLIELFSNDEGSNLNEFNQYRAVQPRTFIRRGKTIPYYKIHSSDDCVKLEADYYIGIDWVLPNKKFVYVAPKINTILTERFDTETKKNDIFEEGSEQPKFIFKDVDYLKMFLDAATHTEILKHTEKLLFIDWNATEIPINQKEDILTPFIVVQFLNLLKHIVRKGLKKSYYKIQANLESKVKGKILVGSNIKTNILKNQITRTVCEYQEFGINNIENRFLKKVLRFVSNYIANNRKIFNDNDVELRLIISYCTPAFENVSNECSEYDLKNIKTNVFFKEYKEAMKLGHHILKRFAYNISSTSEALVSTPPFWIDMPRLFELYVYRRLLNIFESENIKYHFSTYGNELDFLITKEGSKMVVDAKYKLHYDKGHIHEDIRQVAGYARLNRVYQELNIIDDKLIPCLIIYPDLNAVEELTQSDGLLNDTNKIGAYKKVHKIGISLPLI